MNKPIQWKITEQNVSQELVSDDERWHISKKQSGTADAVFFLSNYDLLLAPSGSGTDYKGCFETFIKSCDAYVEKIKQIRLEAQSHLAEMIQMEKEIENHAD